MHWTVVKLIFWVALLLFLGKNAFVYSENSSARENEYSKKVKKDRHFFRELYQKKFKNIDLNDFKDGVYAIDQASREQWLEIEEFAPYEIAIDEGKKIFKTRFSNGKSYKDCFPDYQQGIRQNYPYFDIKSNQVVTLEWAINLCRKNNNESKLAYNKTSLVNLSAYIAFLSRERKLKINVPNQAAYHAYMAGKKIFYSKRGQLNFSCADCHLKAAGLMLRADLLSPAIGHPTGMPVYRSNWGEIGSLHRRYRECNQNVRAKPFQLQSEAYRNLEYFQTLMSQGMPVNGPSSRK
jgi:sulfur-oxidizing protein SoxA